MMRNLPDYDPPVSLAPLDRPTRQYSRGAQFPPIVKLPDGRLIVDEWGPPTIVTIWTQASHPNLAKLPPDAPRSVKRLYTADAQLAYLRGDYDLANRALHDWRRFIAAADRQGDRP